MTPATIWCLAMLISFSLSLFLTLEIHLLCSGLAQAQTLTEPPFSSQQGDRRRGWWWWWGQLLFFSYLALNKSLWWRQQALSPSRSPLIYLCAPLCLTVREQVEHGSSDTFHIVLCCVCSHMPLCEWLQCLRVRDDACLLHALPHACPALSATSCRTEQEGHRNYM